MPTRRCLRLGFLAVSVATGCGGPHAITVDLSADQPRFIIHQMTWGWPFRWPMVDDFVIASEEDGALWELKSTDPAGVPARRLAIVYGDVPPGFTQVHPEGVSRPKALLPGRSYYVGATGPVSIYRVVFALPVAASAVRPDR